MGMAGCGHAKLARRRAIEQPCCQHATVHDRMPFHRYAFGVEGLRAQATHPQRIVDNANAAVEQLLSELILEKAGFARDGCTVHGTHKMPDQRTRHARIEHHRRLAGRDLARVDTCDRPFAGATAYVAWGREIRAVYRGGEIVITLHAGALARDRGHRDALAGALVSTMKAGAGDKHHAADARRGRRAAGFGYALHSEAGFLSLVSAAFEFT